MRGKESNARRKGQENGITPAYAGKSYWVFWRCHADKDHPRVCGEKIAFRMRAFSFWGSPPRMRGKVTYDDDHVPGMRITPAYAGKRLKKIP